MQSAIEELRNSIPTPVNEANGLDLEKVALKVCSLVLKIAKSDTELRSTVAGILELLLPVLRSQNGEALSRWHTALFQV
jgi:hypothetical protein